MSKVSECCGEKGPKLHSMAFEFT